MTDPRNRFRDDPLLRVTGQAMRVGVLAVARACMDEYALEIFDLWISGKAPGEVVFDNPRWAAYMQHDQGLTGQIDRHLNTFALKFRDDFNARPRTGEEPQRVCRRSAAEGLHSAHPLARGRALALHDSRDAQQARRRRLAAAVSEPVTASYFGATAGQSRDKRLSACAGGKPESAMRSRRIAT